MHTYVHIQYPNTYVYSLLYPYLATNKFKMQQQQNFEGLLQILKKSQTSNGIWRF